MSQKPSIPKGTRDLLPNQVFRRNYIFDTIRKAFESYGFLPIETPSFELSSTLMGKYGEEGDRLIFRILNSGDKMKKADLDALASENLPRFANSLSEKALRYDLTVPFARFVVQHQNEITFPFKRYQIQPVWRADRPQHGRYQEFYQCDADVVGSDSLLYEVDFILLLDEVLHKLGIPDFSIKINNRKVLAGIAEVSGEKDKLIPITVAIDKLDKIGKDQVFAELLEKGIATSALEKIQPLFDLEGDFNEKLDQLEVMLSSSETGLKGLSELREIAQKVKLIGLSKAKFELDVTLARGLNYYTGAIIEVKANGVNMGSICGGGRYDDLTGVFGMPGLSGVGVSFGADRIYDVLTELNLFPEYIDQNLRVLFVNFGENEVDVALKHVRTLRKHNISAELYPEAAKLKKQMKYANDRGVDYVVLIGENEINEGTLLVKNMHTGEQETLSIEQLIDRIQ